MRTIHGFNWGVMGALLLLACSNGGSNGDKKPSDPSAPSDLVGGPLGGGVHLTWKDNSDNEEAFQLERKEEGGDFALLDTVPFDTALYHDSDVSLTKAYSYRVRADLPDGFSAYSNVVTVDLANPDSGSAGSSAMGGKGNTSTGGKGNDGTGGATAGSENAAAGDGTNVGGGTSEGGSSANGGTAPNAGTSSGGTSNTPVSFKKDIVPALVKSCGSTTTGCHNNDQAFGRNMPQFGPCKVIWYSAVDEPIGSKFLSGANEGQNTGCPDVALYERLINLRSMLCDKPSWDQRPHYVVPGDLKNSLLYQVIAGDPTFGNQCAALGVPVRRMPLVDPKILPVTIKLTDAEIENIKNWILQGAKNN